MSNLTTILVIIVIGLANICAWWFVDRILRNRVDAIVSGVVRGVPISKEHRRMSLWLSYSNPAGGAAGGQIGIGIAWLVAANNAVADDVKLLLYLVAWIVFAGVAAFVANGILWHRHLASLLRQAEAD